jgi:hypothetical protein
MVSIIKKHKGFGKTAFFLFFCLIIFFSTNAQVFADTITQRYHCCTPCIDDIIAETQQTGDPVSEAAGFVIDAMNKCRARDPNCSPAAERGFCPAQTAPSSVKCADKYPKGQGEGACYPPGQCTKDNFGGKQDVQTVGGQELCEVSGERCCVWSGEVNKPAADAGIPLSDLQNQAKSLNKITGITGDQTGAATLISRIISLLTGFMGSIALVLYIYAGFMWMTAAGAKDRIAKAQNVFVWTTLGAVIMLASYIIVNFVFSSIK